MPVRVLLVEDSPTFQVLLEGLIAADPRLELVHSVASAEAALRWLRPGRVDVISVDIRLPGMDGLQMTRRVMAEVPTPTVVVSAVDAPGERNLALDAISSGALAVLPKPTGAPSARFAQRYCDQLVWMSDVRVIRQRPGYLGRIDTPASDRTAPGSGGDDACHRTSVLGIAASTGGPGTLAKLLGALGDFAIPTVVVQHMTASFLPGFATWLANVTGRDVVLAGHGDPLTPGRVFVAPPDHHLHVRGHQLALAAGPAVDGQLPSATAMFQSMADHHGPYGAGLILTGMGRDGADGVAALRRRGGWVAAESEATATVYGMPRAAVENGAAQVVAAAHDLPEILRRTLVPARAAAQ